jgi:arylsulfatase A-like enzyme
MGRCLSHLLAVGFLLAGAAHGVGAEQPNIIFILADDLGWGDVSFHGGSAPTPVIDALAASSLELRSHYAAPVCSPTRTGLMTGRYWSRFGVVNPQNERALPWETPTIASVLKTAGYDTTLVGKWHLGSKPEQGPQKFGFDECYGSLAGGVTAWEHRYKNGPFTHTWHRNTTLITETGHVTDLITEHAVNWLRARSDAPFFLYLPYTAVHLPVEEPDDWVARVPASIQGDVNRHYAASIMHLDNSVGRILETLDELGKRKDTLIVFTSDNGGSNSENRALAYPNCEAPAGRLPGSNLPFRGQKGMVYEGGIRVPTLVHWTGKIAPRRSDDPAHVVDWMPTLASLAAASIDPEWKLDGIDLTDLLLKNISPPLRPLYVAGVGFQSAALREGEWKLVTRAGQRKQPSELYDLANDLEEKKDVASRFPEIVAHLTRLLEEIREADNDSQVANEKRNGAD